MIKATLHLHSKFQVGEVDDRIFGGFIEHLGRCVYNGIYEPGNRLSNEAGFRSDVLQALREMNVSVARYPGGNFASGYHWQDGIGPQSHRPTTRDLAWQSTEPNTFGTDEFLRYCRELNCEPMLCTNLGTGTPEEAMSWVEYCNSPTGTKFANLREENGNPSPYDVKLWCLGNEMDGPWQLGHVPVEEYVNRARQAAKMMKDCDPSIQTVACGSSGPQMPTFIDWDRTVIEQLGGLADYISLHRYVGHPGDDQEYLAISSSIDSQIETIDECARVASRKHRSGRRTYLCFDEWNVWYRARGGVYSDGRGQFAPPLLEEQYTFADALVVAMFLMSFIRHADSVKIANLAQLVNVIAPIFTNSDGLFKQTIFHAFRMISSRKGGTALQATLDCETYQSKEHGEVPFLDYACILDDDELKIFLLNRNIHESMEISIDSLDLDLQTASSSEILHHQDMTATNSFDDPNEVKSVEMNAWQIQNQATIELPAHSFVATTFKLQ
ncbi:MAG: alpha-N-arabinofuranosidase [Gammaproteobacteria bacterium]|nr:alpha-N-arabinofuranosidase [Gammaproteobacteria bacterium]